MTRSDESDRCRLPPLGLDRCSVEMDGHRVAWSVNPGHGSAYHGLLALRWLLPDPLAGIRASGPGAVADRVWRRQKRVTWPPTSLALRIFRVKRIDTILGETDRGGAPLRKVLGPASLVAFGVGAVIGTGIFATIGTASAGDAGRPGAGPALTISFALTAVVCGFTALCYAEFASMVPVAGSAYTYAYATLGELVAWIIGWDLLLEYAIGNTAVAISWASYMTALLDGMGVHVPRWLAIDYRTAAKTPELLAQAPHLLGVPIVFNGLALAIVVAVTVVLVLGIRESARFNALMVVIKIAILAFFVLVSIKFVRPENWHPFAPNGLSGIGAGAAVIFFAYIGFDAVSTCAEECKNPGRDMPIGIVGSLVVCTVVYVVVAAVFSGLVPYSELLKLDESQRAQALTVAMKYAQIYPWMVGVVAFGSVIAQTAVLLVFQLGQPRILMAMARDGLLPAVFARVHPRFGTPHVSTILTGALVGVVSAFASIDEMVDLTNIGTLFAFVLVCVGIVVMRFREPERARPFRVPFGPLLVPSLGAISCLALVGYLPPVSWARFIGWLATGLLVYGLYGFRRKPVQR
jgi:APA family basic amino acid/polyamine antiporter